MNDLDLSLAWYAETAGNETILLCTVKLRLVYQFVQHTREFRLSGIASEDFYMNLKHLELKLYLEMITARQFLTTIYELLCSSHTLRVEELRQMEKLPKYRFESRSGRPALDRRMRECLPAVYNRWTLSHRITELIHVAVRDVTKSC